MLCIDPKRIDVQSVNQCVASNGFPSFDVASLVNSNEFNDCVFLTQYNLSLVLSAVDRFDVRPLDVRVTSLTHSDIETYVDVVIFLLTIHMSGKWEFTFGSEATQPMEFPEEFESGDIFMAEDSGTVIMKIRLSKGVVPFHEYVYAHADYYAAITPVLFYGSYGEIVHNQ